MVLGYSLLRAYVAEHIQLLLVFSTHTFFLSGCVVETREFCGTALASNRVFPHPARGWPVLFPILLRRVPCPRLSVFGETGRGFSLLWRRAQAARPYANKI